MKLTSTLAERVAARMRRDGFDCATEDVYAAWLNGTIDSRESLASRILQEFEELGIESHA